MIVTPNPILGAFLHSIGATSAALCYTPQKKVRGWSWQTYWLVQASFCWLILPVLGAWWTIPQLGLVLAEAPREAMLKAFLLGALYGVGGTAFGLAIRYIGFSLTYALAIGISCVLGTLAGPLVAGELGAIMAKPGGGIVVAGVAIGAAGILLVGLAGRMKEKNLAATGPGVGEFHFAKGLALCLLAGVLSAVYGFSLQAGQPIADVAAAHGAGEFQGNVIYIFSNTGAFLTTAVYCIFLHSRNGTAGEVFRAEPGAPASRLRLNWAMAVLTGCLWYGQFFFYGLGHTRMGSFAFSSWALHMTMLVLVSATVGVVLREWRGCQPATKLMLTAALVVLLGAVSTLTWGNYLGSV
ncbi:MAG: rhamnose:proton symporter [Opitutaceae bacterium]|nr:rhamnose:proton symporter [Opitutaceae bacterium]